MCAAAAAAFPCPCCTRPERFAGQWICTAMDTMIAAIEMMPENVIITMAAVPRAKLLNLMDMRIVPLTFSLSKFSFRILQLRLPESP